jgi:hypothetical protein
LISTKAQKIFLTTATDMPLNKAGYYAAAEEEYSCIIQFFETLKDAYAEDGLPRTVVFSTKDNVEELCRRHLDETGDVWIEPLDDGSIVPHYSANGSGGENAMELLRDTPDLELILLTTPFLYSNFLAFFAPLPNEGKTQWELPAAFGDGATKIDMMSGSDLGQVVASLFEDSAIYKGQNLRVAS